MEYFQHLAPFLAHGSFSVHISCLHYVSTRIWSLNSIFYYALPVNNFFNFHFFSFSNTLWHQNIVVAWRKHPVSLHSVKMGLGLNSQGEKLLIHFQTIQFFSQVSWVSEKDNFPRLHMFMRCTKGKHPVFLRGKVVITQLSTHTESWFQKLILLLALHRVLHKAFWGESKHWNKKVFSIACKEEKYGVERGNQTSQDQFQT